MKTPVKIIAYFLLFIPLICRAETKEIPFSQEDRERMIRTELKVDGLGVNTDLKIVSLRSEMNAGFEAVDKQFAGFRSEMNARFDQLFNFLWAMIGIFTAMMVSVFGFAFWDRKLSLAPVKKENRALLNALREYSEHQPKLREILKNAGLL